MFMFLTDSTIARSLFTAFPFKCFNKRLLNSVNEVQFPIMEGKLLKLLDEQSGKVPGVLGIFNVVSDEDQSILHGV